MSIRINSFLGAALIACAILAGTSTASAQVVFKGNVALTSETRWSSTVLEPGTYEVTVERLMRDGSLIHIYGQGKQVAILAGPAELAPVTRNGKLELERVNGVDVVRKFVTGTLGQTYSFQVPKAARMEAMQRNSSADVAVDATH